MPPTPNKEARIELRVSDREKALLQKAAEARGLTLSAWVRMIALEAAREEKR